MRKWGSQNDGGGKVEKGTVTEMRRVSVGREDERQRRRRGRRGETNLVVGGMKAYTVCV